MTFSDYSYDFFFLSNVGPPTTGLQNASFVLLSFFISAVTFRQTLRGGGGNLLLSILPDHPERGGVSMLITDVQVDASITPLSASEIFTSSPPHPIIPLGPSPHLSSPNPCFLVLCLPLKKQTPPSQNIRFICFWPGCRSRTRGVQTADLLVSG